MSSVDLEACTLPLGAMMVDALLTWRGGPTGCPHDPSFEVHPAVWDAFGSWLAARGRVHEIRADWRRGDPNTGLICQWCNLRVYITLRSRAPTMILPHSNQRIEL